MNLADKRAEATEDEITNASNDELRDAMLAIESDFYRGLEICHKDIIRRYHRTGEIVKEDAVLVVLTHRQWWVDRPERERIANEEYYAPIIRQYGHMSIEQLEEALFKLENVGKSLAKAGRREFNGNGGRRTSAAVANEGARSVGEHKMRLQSYLRWRKELENGN